MAGQADEGPGEMPAELREPLAVLLPMLLAALDHLEWLTRLMDPRRLADLAAALGPDDAALMTALDRVFEAVPRGTVPPPLLDGVVKAGESVLRAHHGLRQAAPGENGTIGAYRAARQQYRAIEALYPLIRAFPSISRFFIEPARREHAALLAQIDTSTQHDTGVYHFDNDTGQRGGFSVYVPEYLTRATPAPVVFALHGGSGHGRVFLWSWLREARSRGAILVSPTASGETWSLMEPETDAARLAEILRCVRDRWPVDPARLLLSGMSDGGTFTLLSGLDADSPFTHLAPVAASFHPLLVTMAEPRRMLGLPVYLVHGALDWMFPIQTGRTANQVLTMAGAKVVFREIADLSHTYPRDENGAILDWLMAGRSVTV